MTPRADGRTTAVLVFALRQALRTWVDEVYPEATTATLVLILADGDQAAVPVADPWDRGRLFAGPRATAARARVAELVRRVYPEAARADVVFYLGGWRSGVLPLPLG
jgi:hypothetical protein